MLIGGNSCPAMLQTEKESFGCPDASPKKSSCLKFNCFSNHVHHSHLGRVFFFWGGGGFLEVPEWEAFEVSPEWVSSMVEIKD